MDLHLQTKYCRKKENIQKGQKLKAQSLCSLLTFCWILKAAHSYPPWWLSSCLQCAPWQTPWEWVPWYVSLALIHCTMVGWVVWIAGWPRVASDLSSAFHTVNLWMLSWADSKCFQKQPTMDNLTFPSFNSTISRMLMIQRVEYAQKQMTKVDVVLIECISGFVGFGEDDNLCRCGDVLEGGGSWWVEGSKRRYISTATTIPSIRSYVTHLTGIFYQWHSLT